MIYISARNPSWDTALLRKSLLTTFVVEYFRQVNKNQKKTFCYGCPNLGRSKEIIANLWADNAVGISHINLASPALNTPAPPFQLTYTTKMWIRVRRSQNCLWRVIRPPLPSPPPPRKLEWKCPTLLTVPHYTSISLLPIFPLFSFIFFLVSHLSYFLQSFFCRKFDFF